MPKIKKDWGAKSKAACLLVFVTAVLHDVVLGLSEFGAMRPPSFKCEYEWN
jgi:hypothetical protein